MAKPNTFGKKPYTTHTEHDDADKSDPSLYGHVTALDAMASAEMSFAPSNCTSRWLRVGKAPTSLMTFISTCVPYAGKPWPVTALSAKIFFFSAVTFMKALGSRTLPTPKVPRTATALR